MSRKDKIITSLTIVILLLVIVLALVFNMKKLNVTSKVSPKEDNKEDKVVTTELNEKEINTLLDKIKIYDNYFITFEGSKKPSELTDDEKFLFYMKNNYEKFTKGVSSKEIEKKVKTQYEKYKGMFKIYTYTFETDSNIENSYLVSLTR